MANNINHYSFLNVLDVPIVDKTDVTKVIVIDRDNTVKTMESNQIGFTDYDDLENKPFINNIELKGNISLDELDIPAKSIIDGEINDLKESDKLINSNILDLQNNKVDKEPGKSLIADSEIERLKTLKNYDDTQIKNEVSNNTKAIENEVQRATKAEKDNADAIKLKLDKTEASSIYATKTELNTKVDKVEGSRLITNAEAAQINTNKTDINNLKNNKLDKTEASQNYATKIDLNTKVDKVEGKSLLADSEIERLKTLTNYNDSTIKGDINKLQDEVNKNKTNIDLKLSKTEAESLYQPKGEYATKAELNNKVDKVTGKSLLEDTEIARLKTLVNYDDTEVKSDITQLKTDVEDNMHNISTNSTAISNINTKLKNTENLFVLNIPENKQLDTDTFNSWQQFVTNNPSGGAVITIQDGQSVLSTEYNIDHIYGGVYDDPGGNGLMTRLVYISNSGAITVNDDFDYPLTVEDKGKPDGVASLDKSGKVPTDQIPTPEGGYLRPLFEKMPNVKYNPSTKMYDIWKDQGGISVTEDEMADIYNNSIGNPIGSSQLFIQADCRAIIFRSTAFYHSGNMRDILFKDVFFDSTKCELIALGFGTGYLLNPYFNTTGLVRVVNPVKISDTRTYTPVAIEYITFQIDKSKTLSLGLPRASKLRYETLRSMPDGTIGDTYSNITTVTVHSTPYSLLTGTATGDQYTATGHTKEEWMKIVTDGTAKGITFAKSI